jgi:hypothetical protein
MVKTAFRHEAGRGLSRFHSHRLPTLWRTSGKKTAILTYLADGVQEIPTKGVRIPSKVERTLMN